MKYETKCNGINVIIILLLSDNIAYQIVEFELKLRGQPLDFVIFFTYIVSLI